MWLMGWVREETLTPALTLEGERTVRR